MALFTLSIRRKLIAISMLTVAVALTGALAVFHVTSQRAYRDLVEHDINSTALVISENSTAALSFGDAETAAEILRSLEATPHMDVACLYDANGQLFAHYMRSSVSAGCPGTVAGTIEQTSAGASLRRPVMLAQKQIGTLYLHRNYDDLTASQRTQIMVLVPVVLGALILALFLSSLLQHFVSAPIRHLVQTARSVSARKDYSIRASKQTEDELGVLVDSFNEMLSQVETRDSQLQTIRAALESNVVELRHEVSERKRMEEERGELLRREREANRLKDEFLATVSHELRTPLNAILGWSRMLGSGVLDAEASSRALQTIERNARVQAYLIEDLLDISRIMSGRLRLEAQSLRLDPVIDAALDAIRPAAEAKQITIERHLDPAAGPVVGDPDRLQQVVWNLLSNAMKFTPAGQRVEVRLASTPTHVEVVVADSGQGIDAAFLPHVFDSFRQADSTSTRQYGGLGLGLAIVRHLVELHGGEVEAASAGPGKGATFTVRIPRAPDDARSPSSDTPREAPTSPSLSADNVRRLDGIRVLVVDDEEDTLTLLTTVIGHFGAQARGATSSREALSILDGWRADVIVSDIGLPVEDGYSFLQTLRRWSPDRGGRTPAIALTAYARPGDRVRALAAGFQLHIAKPVEPVDLISALASLARQQPRQPSAATHPAGPGVFEAN